MGLMSGKVVVITGAARGQGRAHAIRFAALNQATYDLFLPGAGLSADSPDDEEKVAEAFKGLNSMPIPWIEPEDIANAAIFLSSEMGRYISGTQLRVDAGSAVK